MTTIAFSMASTLCFQRLPSLSLSLVTSTFFTLWVVPLGYTLLEDGWEAIGHRVAWALRRPASVAIAGRADKAPTQAPQGTAAPAS